MTTLLGTMARNNAWANEVLYEAVCGLDAAQFDAPRIGFFPSLRATLTHIYEVDLYYIDALEQGGQGRSVYGTTPAGVSPADLADLQRAADLRLVQVCDATPVVGNDQTVITQRPDGDVVERVIDLLPHLFQHQVHHRGQVHAMLSGTDVPPPQLDDFHTSYGRVATAQAWHDYQTRNVAHVS